MPVLGHLTLGNGTIIRVIPPTTQLVRVVPVIGPMGPPGPAGSWFVHTQTTPAASVAISHPLGRLPGVAIWVAGELVIADVTATPTTVLVVFTSPTAFTAVMT